MEELRKEFIIASKTTSNFSSLCREFGITRKTGYKWIARAEETNDLSDRSHARKNISNKTDKETENLILSVRKDNPAWGGKTIRQVLVNQGHEDLPCVKTCNNILKRNGCISEEESLKHKPFVRFERDKCNQMWQTDFKGDFALLDGTRCFPLDILDDHSRFSIKIAAKPNTLGVADSFREAFYEYGMPDSVLSDNGWTFRGFRNGYTHFEKWLMNHDILPIHGRIMHPQTQGKIERFHRTMKTELLNQNKFKDILDADRGLQEWRMKYNNIRPHEALNMKCPAEVYIPSDRTYIDNIKKFEYGGQHHVIKVNSWGYVRFNGWQVYLSETMINENIEFRPNPHGDSFFACYRNFKIAEFSNVTGELLNRKISRI
ncbi:MAG: IS481 family transposase [Lachnospiraceae bacterium]|nr:IS481 family transposase [Lachnospiraceae bacterium]